MYIYYYSDSIRSIRHNFCHSTV